MKEFDFAPNGCRTTIWYNQ